MNQNIKNGKKRTYRRIKTLGSQHFSSYSSQKNSQQFIKNRIKTITEGKAWNQLKHNKLPNKSHSSCYNMFAQQQELQQEQQQHKMKDNPYWDKTSLVHNDFIEEIQKIKQNKSDTYRRLRGKLVKKFPQFKKKYADFGPQANYSQQSSEKNTIFNGHPSFYRTSNHSFNSNNLKVSNQSKQYQYFRNVKFYSRSKRRCLTDFLEPEQIIDNKIQIEVPKMSYLAYLKHAQQRKKMQGLTSKGLNLLKKRSKILEIQKQGTRSYAKLKKSLQQAIQTCNKKNNK